MKKYVYANLVVLFLASSMAFADGEHGVKRGQDGGKRESHQQHNGKKQDSHKPVREKTIHAVPEIDATGAGIAFALLAGLIAVYHERRGSREY